VGWCMVSLASVSLTAAGDLRLVEAVKTGNTEAVRALLKQHVDVNAPQADGATALHWAAHRDDLTAADLLIRAGANVNAANDLGADVRARSRRYTQNVETGNRGGGGEVSAVPRGGSTPLLFAARVGDVESARLLLAAGADVNDALPDGTSALVIAAHSGQGALGVLL